MSPLVFLGLALAVFVVVSSISWFVHRERRTTFESSIDRFRNDMGQLSPHRSHKRNRRR